MLINFWALERQTPNDKPSSLRSSGDRRTTFGAAPARAAISAVVARVYVSTSAMGLDHTRRRAAVLGLKDFVIWLCGIAARTEEIAMSSQLSMASFNRATVPVFRLELMPDPAGLTFRGWFASSNRHRRRPVPLFGAGLEPFDVIGTSPPGA